MMTCTVRKFGVGVASLALVASMAVPALAAPSNTLPGSFVNKIARLSGVDRIDTAMAVARHEYTTIGKGGNGHQAKVAYLVNSTAMIDAAAAGMLVDGPIVLVDNNRRTSNMIGQFLKNSNESDGGAAGFKGIQRIIAIGGENVISKQTLQDVAQIAGVAATDRFGGKDRYETAVKIAERVYSQALKSEHGYAGLASEGRLSKVYLANGADGHVVDSMVAGVLDDGPVLLVKPTGELPETVKAFIKKTLPASWGVLGGKSAVSDEAANTARSIAVYGNDWSEAFNVPALREQLADLKRKVEGNGTSRLVKSPFFMGYNGTWAEANKISVQWAAKYAKAQADVNTAIVDLGRVKAVEVTNAKGQALKSALEAMYTSKVIGGTEFTNYLTKTDEGYVNGFEFNRFEAVELKKTISDGVDDINRVWGVGDQDYAKLKDAVAKASQDSPTGNFASTDAVPGPAVLAVAKYVTETQGKLLEAAKKELVEVRSKLDAALNKIDFTAEGRLSGKNRYETAAAVAQYWAKKKGHTFDNVYVASGTALPDALVAGQLSRGPVLLVQNGAQLPKATAAVAAALPFWDLEGAKEKTAYGIGGKLALGDEQLEAIAKAANSQVKEKSKTNDKLVQTASVAGVKGSDNATVTFSWDKEAITSDDVKVVADGFTAPAGSKLKASDLTVSKGVVTIPNDKIDVAGTVSFNVEFRGVTAKGTVEVYSGASTAPAGLAFGTSKPSAAALTNGTGDLPELTAQTAGTAPADWSNVKVVKGSITVKDSGGAAKPALVSKVKLTVDATNKQVKAVFTRDAAWAQNDVVTFKLENTETGKATTQSADFTITVDA